MQNHYKVRKYICFDKHMLNLNLSYHNVVYAIKFLFITKWYYILQCENRLMANASRKQLEW